MIVVPFKPSDVLAALRAGKARDFTAEDFMAYSGAPAGSCMLECFGDDWQVVVGSGFQVEAHTCNFETGDLASFIAHADGHWETC